MILNSERFTFNGETFVIERTSNYSAGYLVTEGELVLLVVSEEYEEVIDYIITYW